jgi:hypothetical protein
MHSEVEDGELVRFRSEARRLLKERCGDEKLSSAVEDTPVSDSQKNSEPDAIWDGQAVCAAGDEQVLQCEHGSANGRGVFVYSGSESPDNHPTLVCVHFEASYLRPFEREQLVDARCVVTEFDWRYESQRSDVVGIRNWATSAVNHAPMQIPAALKNQCNQVFPDALYCTPTLIIFPDTSSRSRVGICRLRTSDSVLGLGALLRIGSWNSRWECESKSLDVPDRDERLTVEERSCIPDHLGRQQNPFCRFPYLPVARRPVRTFLD